MGTSMITNPEILQENINGINKIIEKFQNVSINIAQINCQPKCMPETRDAIITSLTECIDDLCLSRSDYLDYIIALEAANNENENLLDTLGNLFFAALFGLGNVLEDGLDFLEVGWAWIIDKHASVFDWIGMDGAANVLQEVVDFLTDTAAETWAEDAYNYLYTEVDFFKEMNENSWFSNDGLGCQVAYGLMYYLPVRILEKFVPGRRRSSDGGFGFWSISGRSIT